MLFAMIFRNFAIWEVLREEEFSPLKNNLDAKSDNARTCKEDISNLHSRWLEKAGASLVEDYEVNDTRLECEISPLVSYSGEVILI
jgi:UDP-N-acetylglucosamine/UDP-N-acetylgalactosamine diphosphorylase